MKTLVIHPKDHTTDFLKEIYSDKNWNVINENVPKRLLKKEIIEHDRIIMLGHGTERGLIGENERSLIDSSFVYLLREKDTVCIWCNADVFVEKYGLKGLYTGMIVSDWMEANLFCVHSSSDEIEESNILFSKSIKESIVSNDLENIKKVYDGETDVIQFNRENIYLK